MCQQERRQGGTYPVCSAKRQSEGSSGSHKSPCQQKNVQIASGAPRRERRLLHRHARRPSAPKGGAAVKCTNQINGIQK